MCANQVRPAGLILAMDQEFDRLRGEVGRTASRRIAGLAFHEGRVAGLPVVAVRSGIGKVNAAIATTLLIEAFGCDAVVCSGVAGALDPRLGVGDAVIATRAIQHDYGAQVDQRLTRYQPGTPPLPGFATDHGFTPAEALLARLKTAVGAWTPPPIAIAGHTRSPALHFGAILSGDQFLACAATRDRLHRETGGLAIEMEGAAIAQAAEALGVPWVIARTVSDLAGSDSHLDFLAFVEAVADGAAGLLRRILPAVKGNDPGLSAPGAGGARRSSRGSGGP